MTHTQAPGTPAAVVDEIMGTILEEIQEALPDLLADHDEYNETADHAAQVNIEVDAERAVLVELAQRLVVACGISLDELRLGGPMSEDPVFEITDPDEPCDCGCGMAEDAR